MGELKNQIVGYSMVLLFAMSLFIFMSQFLTYNNPSSSIINNSYVNQTSAQLQSSTRGIQSVAVKAKTLLESDSDPQKAILYPFLIIFASFSVVFSFLGFLINGVLVIIPTLLLLITGSGGIQGDSSVGLFIVFSVINGILILGIVLAILKGMRTGDT